MKRFVYISVFLLSCINVYCEEILDGEIFQIDDSLLNLELPISRLRMPRRVIYNNDSIFDHNQKIHFTPNDSSHKNIIILTSTKVFSNLSFEVKRYAEDIHAIYGTGVICEVVKNATPEQLKSVILSYDNLCGAIFIGDLGEAYFEIDNDHNKYGYRNWPCDLFFMDLDGIWQDTDSNGIYDLHTGNVQPEIFVARLCGSNVSSIGEEIELTRRQLNKSHRFWWDASFFQPDSVLNYINFDWKNSFHPSHMNQILSPNKIIDIRSSIDSCFSKNDYLYRISNGNITFTHIAAHSNARIHQMNGSYIYVNELLNNNSNNIAYNLFCCSACDWTANNYNYLGATYLFDGFKTLTVIGSTKTGSMLGQSFFYRNFPSTHLGNSLVNWWRDYCGSSHNNNEISWFYGISILGDPTINFRHNISNFCTNNLELNLFPIENKSNLILYKAESTITIGKDLLIPSGVHVIFDAPNVKFDNEFKCPKGATIETRTEGCRLTF